MVHRSVKQGYQSVLARFYKASASHGFLLPVVIALGLGISTVSLVAMQTVAQNSVTLSTQYYTQIAREAAQAGVTAAANCIRTTKPLADAWTNTALTPEKNCTITTAPALPGGGTQSAYIDDNSQFRSTYSVVKPTYQDANNTSMLITSTGKVSIKIPGGGTALAAQVTVHGYGTFPSNNEVVPTNYKPVKSLSAGSSTVCSIATDPTTRSDWAYCWGSNAYGMLGIGKNIADNRSTSPIAVAQAAVPAMPSVPDPCGGFFQPGCSVGASPAVPANPMIGKKVTKISVGVSHVCAVATDTNGANGKAYCWGDNSSGQLGNYTTTSSSVPVEVDVTGARALIPGIPAQSCGFFCTIPAVPEVPAKLASALQNKQVVDITAGDNFTCALTSDGNVDCWGLNNNGQLGTGNRTNYSYPVAVDNTFPGTPAIPAIPAIPGYSCGFFCYVPDVPGVPGVPAVPPTALLGKTVTTLAELKSGATMCVNTNSGDPVCWGQNYVGQVGNGQSGVSSSNTSDCSGGATGTPIAVTTAADALRPSAVQGSTKFGSYTIYENYTTAISQSGRAYWWGGTTSTSSTRTVCGHGGGGGTGQGPGNNKFEVTTTRTYNSQSSPAGPLYNSGTGSIYGSSLAFNAGNPKSGLFCAGLSTNKQIWCDANGTSIAEGETGSGYTACTNLFGIGCPALPTGLQTVTMTAFGDASIDFMDSGTSGYACAVTVDGQVFCWGNNASGQLGVLPASNRNIPSPVDINLTTSALYSSGAGTGSGTTYGAYTLRAVY